MRALALALFLFLPGWAMAQLYPTDPVGTGNASTTKVGVGTNAPVELLHVYSTAQYPRISVQSAHASGAPGIDLRDASGLPKFAWHYDIANGFMGFFQNGFGNRLVIKNNGNVGIGTTNPLTKLQVDGENGVAATLNINNPSVGVSASYDIAMAPNNNIGAGLRAYVPSTGYDRVYLGLYTTTFTNSLQSRVERMTISDAGNVGIGTTSPNGKFEVRHGSDNTMVYLRQDKNNGGTGDVFFLRDDRGYSATNTGTTFKVESWKGGGISNGGTLANFVTINDGVAMSRLLIDNTTGNVGIGTTTPTGKLEVRHGGDQPLVYVRQDKNNGGMSDVFSLRDDRGYSATNTGTTFKVESWKGAGISNGGTLANFVTINDGVAMSRLLIDNTTGNVGIGTPNPNQKLTVNGTIYGKEVKVDLNVPGPDYVFEKDYHLPSLESVKTYIDENKHLPEVPSAKEMEANGVNLSEMNMLLLKKVEELTLYVLELKKENMEQSREISKLKNASK